MEIASTSTSVSNYLELQPVMHAMKAANDHSPKNSLPSDTEGTIQQNADAQKLPKVTIYNAHGIIVNNKNLNSLIAYA
jgi:cytochrome bd-type quinol oxidase subunit 1